MKPLEIELERACDAHEMTIELPDIAHHQGGGAIPAIAAAGYPAAIIKLTEGRDYLDPRARENWAALLGRPEMVRGAYHFCRPNTDGGGEADGRAEGEWFCRNLLELGGFGDGCLPPAADIEGGGMDDDHTAQQNIDFLAAFEAAVVRLLGRSPMIYTGKNTWSHRFDWTMKFDHLPLWWARYTSTPGDLPWPLTFWQYTGEGRVAGISGNVDLNRFEGTLAELRALALPQVWTPDAAEHRGPVMPWIDLSSVVGWSIHVEQVQRLLNVHGYGLAPDGLAGPKTLEAWLDFAATGSTIVDWPELLGRL